VQVVSKRGIALLLAIFFLGLLYTFPARIFIPMLNPERAGVYLQGVEGFWHRGGARSLEIHSVDLSIRLHDVQWDAWASSLLIGRAGAELEAKFSGKPVRFSISRNTAGDLDIHNLSADILFADIRPILRQLIVPVDGRLILQEVDLGFDGRWFDYFRGNAELKNLVATMPVGPLSIGDMTFELSQADSAQPASDQAGLPLQAEIIEYSGDYGLGGSVSMQQSNWAVVANLSSRPDPAVPPMIVQQMGLLFGPPVNGQFTLNYSDE